MSLVIIATTTVDPLVKFSGGEGFAHAKTPTWFRVRHGGYTVYSALPYTAVAEWDFQSVRPSVCPSQYGSIGSRSGTEGGSLKLQIWWKYFTWRL